VYGIEFLGTTNQPALVLGFTDNTFNYITGSSDVSNDPTGLGKWVNIVGTYDGSFGKIYVNGVLENTVVINKTLRSNVADFVIGAAIKEKNDYYLDGEVGSGYVYSRSLTAAEIKQNFNAQNDRFGLADIP
jgi:hypothetical protein